ncbi:ABC-type taurine transport system substrate-binding protein [Pseudomonas sp. GGS8]|nr:ABC-type taurine transport system substrate-binding protein [Pseudomonas sp. GGS8]
MMAKRALSSQFVTVYVSILFSLSTQAATLTFGYQTGVAPRKVPQADGDYEKTIGHKIDWRRFNSSPQVVNPAQQTAALLDGGTTKDWRDGEVLAGTREGRDGAVRTSAPNT